MPKPWMKDYVVIPMAQSDENQSGNDQTPGRDTGVEAPDNGVQFAGFGETRIHVNPALFEQVPRIDTSVNQEPDAQTDADDIGLLDRDQDRSVLTPRGRLQRIITPGPIDPLTQQPSLAANDISDKDYAFALMRKIAMSLDSILVATRANIPILPGRISYDGIAPGGAMVANTPVKMWCQIEAKNVPILKVVVQNNSGAVLNLDFDKIATPGSIQVPANGGLYEGITMADWISISTNGTPTLNGNSATGIVVRVWTNPEWRNMWGQ